jgi:DNA gyrase subunit B
MAKKQDSEGEGPKPKGGDYTAGQIQVLKGLEAVRKRPGMYIGSTSARGLHHLVYEVVDNSIDEAMAGYCTHIEVTVHEDNSVTVSDDGRGIPVDVHPTEGVPGVELAMTVLHAGGKFDKETYKVSGGLHGVGVSVVNALSEYLEVEIHRDGRLYHQRYERGIKAKDLEDRGKAKGRGTTVTFKPDAEIFTELEYSHDTLSSRLRELAFLNKGLGITLKDERGETPQEDTYRYEGGLAEYVTFLRGNKKPIHEKIVYFEGSRPEAEIELALQYDEGFSENTHTFVNNINTHEGGAHLTGFKSALTRTINDYARRNNIFKKDETLSGDDVREGLTCVLSVRVMEPQFEGQTKTKLGNSEVTGAVATVVNEQLGIFLEENPKAAKQIIEKSLQAARAREAARKARDLARKKSALESGVLPGKLADCSLSEPSMCELYIVEGDSAGGCFSGDTRVALADGRHVSFEQLVEEHAAGRRNYCYTIRKDGTIGLEEILHPRVTKRAAEVVRVVLDNDEAITCTPDHLFMLRDGSYRRADELAVGESLMPLYRKVSDKAQPGVTIDGYEMAWDPRSDSWLFTHVLADWYNRWKGVYGKADGDRCHHLDFDKRNNNPDNIRRLPADVHLDLHRRHVGRTLHRPDVIEKGRKHRQTASFRRKMSERMRQPGTREVLSQKASQQWRDPQYRRFMSEAWHDFYRENEKYREDLKARFQQAQHDWWSNASNRKVQAERTKRFFDENPERRIELSELAKQQWADPELREWRGRKTSEQWTPEFRAKRRAALDRTYYNKTIIRLRDFLKEDGSVDLDAFRAARKEAGDRTVLRFETFCSRYFDADSSAAIEAVRNHNHRVTRIEVVERRMDVYDIEVPGTHNFALASGVFVHNSAKQGRDRQYQAILPLKGKILNVERARIDRILGNEEIRAMITAIGAGIREDFNITNTRYHKIIVMTDADVDGSHIRTLLLTFFFRQMPDLIEAGYIYIAQPPLYRVQKGKQEHYAYSEGERDEIIKRITNGKGEDVKGVNIQRYKGLGEMNPDQLWKTTMDPDARTILRVDVEDAAIASKIFDELMGDEVEPRRNFIEKNAKYVRNLDV